MRPLLSIIRPLPLGYGILHILLDQFSDELAGSLIINIIIHTDRTVVSGILILAFLHEDLVLHLVQFGFLGV